LSQAILQRALRIGCLPIVQGRTLRELNLDGMSMKGQPPSSTRRSSSIDAEVKGEDATVVIGQARLGHPIRNHEKL